MADMMSIIAANYKTVGMTVPTKTPYVAVEPKAWISRPSSLTRSPGKRP